MSDIHKICLKLIKKYDLFWQYPVITEKIVFEQQKNNNLYIGLPWATIIDKKINITNLLNELKDKLSPDFNYITCCQHIYFRKIIDQIKNINIAILYSPHKIKNENKIKEIFIKPCPLYAVNVEDKTRNSIFLYKNFVNQERLILYSFQGSYQNIYLSKIRLNILEMEHPKNCYVAYSGNWHFNKLVYNHQVNNQILTEEDNNKHNKNTIIYNKLLLNSKFSLCPSGTGPNSIRFWESLAVGCIPVLLSDTLELPEHKLWKDAIIFMKEDQLNNLNSIINSISAKREKEMRYNCLKIYNDFKNNFLMI